MKRYAPVIIFEIVGLAAVVALDKAIVAHRFHEQVKEKGDMEGVHVRGAADGP